MSNGNGHHWSKFSWRDWSGDLALHSCSISARGFWMELLCRMHEGAPIGHLTINGRPATHRQMSIFAACTVREAKKYEAELEEAGVFSRTDDGVIYCRRMAREAVADAAAREAWQAYGTAGGNPQIIRGSVAKAERQRPYRRSDAPQKTERIFQRDGGRCHWCHEQLERDNPRHPLYFHIDHIVAVRDGGGTDEDNLVASCQRCNMKRARHTTEDGGPPKPNGTGTHSDTNPAEIPTATLGTVRQQPSEIPTATIAPAQESEPDSEVEEEKERKGSILNHLLTTSPASARAVEACQAPPPGTYGDPAIQLAAQTIVEKLGRSLESSGKSPPGKPAKRSALVQAAAVLRGPLWDDEPVLLEGEILEAPIRRGPCDPQRTVAEQFIALGFPELAARAAASP